MLIREGWLCCGFFSSRRRQTRCALGTGVQTCALPIAMCAAARIRTTEPRTSTFCVEDGLQLILLEIAIELLDIGPCRSTASTGRWFAPVGSLEAFLLTDAVADTRYRAEGRGSERREPSRHVGDKRPRSEEHKSELQS